MAYNTSSQYKQIIYSGDARHKVKIWFNGVELADADRYCEKITRMARILPNDGSKRFSIDNFMSQEIDLILHDINTSIIQDQVEISIGTLISENNYEYVPLGIFNIQGSPTNDKNKITIKLRDNRVKFDFGYNAKPLIDANDGKATKRQILEDICEQANVICNVGSFLGENDEIGIYDSTISGTMYVVYIASQAGAIPFTNRNGELIFIYLNDLTTIKIPLYLVEKYEIGTPYNIERVVYEDGIRKFQSSDDETLSTLYLDSANPYISSEEQVDAIYNLVDDFRIDSITTGKILGDPAIDPYDLIEVYGYYELLPNGNKRFVDDENNVVFRTLANHTMTYTGKVINVYDTQIGLEQRKENVSLLGDANFRKNAQTLIDNINNNIRLIVAEQNEQQEQINQTIIDVQSIQNLFQITGGSNLIKNSQFLLTDQVWEIDDEDGYVTPLGAGYNANLIGKTTAIANIVLQNASINTKENNISGLISGQRYTLNYYYTIDENTTATISLVGNQSGNVIYSETFTNEEQNLKRISFTFEAYETDYTLSIQSSTTLDGYFTIYDLMLNSGDVKNWEPATSEIYSTVLKMSQLGLQVYASGSKTITLLTSMGFKIHKSNNGEIGELVTDFTDTGINTIDINASGKVKVGKFVQRDLIINGNVVHVEYMEV